MTTSDTSSISSEEQTRGMISHLVAGVFGIVGALVVWFLHKNQSGFVRGQATGALNFQIGVFIVEVVAMVVGSVVWPLSFLVGLAWLAGVVFAALGAMTVNNGRAYHYPLSLRLVT